MQTSETEFVGPSTGNRRRRVSAAWQGVPLNWAAERLRICNLHSRVLLLRLECAFLRAWLTTQALLSGGSG